MTTPPPDAPLSSVEAARAKLQAVLGGADPQARLAGVLRALPDAREWDEATCRDRYDRDVTFLLSLAEFDAACIAELEMVVDVRGSYLHAARVHIAGLEAKLERVTTLAVIAASGLRAAREKDEDAPASAEEHREEAEHALRWIVPDASAWWQTHSEIGRLRQEMLAERQAAICAEKGGVQ